MTALTDKVRDLGIGVGWTHPFFLPALSRITLTEVPEDHPHIRTMAVRMDGRVSINPAFARALPDLQLAGVLFHEIMHLMMDHAHRKEDRTVIVEDDAGNPIALWNIACDMAINHVLREMGIQLPPGACYPPPGQEGLNAEQLYDYLLKNVVQPPKKGGSGRGRAPAGAKADQAAGGCGVEPGDEPGKGGEGEGEDGQGHGGSAPMGPEDWEKVAVQARALAAGTAAGNALSKLFERKQALRWEQLCRATVSRAVAQHGRDDQTWTKRGRRSCQDPAGRIVLPGWKATKATVCGVIDASGSVSDEQLNRAIDQLQRISEVASARLYLVVHDYEVQTAGWVDGRKRGAIYSRIKGRGGTSFHPAYEAVAKARHPFDVMVHLTDGEIGNDWPDKPANARRLVVALLGDCAYASKPPVGTTTVKVQL